MLRITYIFFSILFSLEWYCEFTFCLKTTSICVGNQHICLENSHAYLVNDVFLLEILSCLLELGNKHICFENYHTKLANDMFSCIFLYKCFRKFTFILQILTFVLGIIVLI